MDLLNELMDAERLAALVALYGGLYLVALIIFAETGLFVGFFLPGDSLLFVTGIMIANSLDPTSNIAFNLIYWILLISLAGITGYAVGYWFGKRTGPYMFQRKDSLLFKRRHLVQAKEFYEKHGSIAIVLARFLPIVRTFAPIVAGVVMMDRRKFFLCNALGSLIWVGSMIMSGYLLGENEWVKQNFEKIVLAIILLTTGPVLLKLVLSRRPPVIILVGKEAVEESLGLNDETGHRPV